MRQAGVVAAAGAYALDHHIDRLAEDHAHALLLAKGLTKASKGRLKIETPQTNILWAEMSADILDAFGAHLKANDILVSAAYGKQRWVTHLDVTQADIERAVSVTAEYFGK